MQEAERTAAQSVLKSGDEGTQRGRGQREKSRCVQDRQSAFPWRVANRGLFAENGFEGIERQSRNEVRIECMNR